MLLISLRILDSLLEHLETSSIKEGIYWYLLDRFNTSIEGMKLLPLCSFLSFWHSHKLRNLEVLLEFSFSHSSLKIDYQSLS